ncbi:DUF2306 domain-containing protein [Blastococcus xanthinilyticus]|uniref:Putative membrane protein DUF2306 n=1 Tax=Blastococcus xanthinilyticus TaxID=1564164 RepID=A0A5S5CUU2_9ACTN|nr:DUF2306 domain-containing protein [Blastococcus xanthinilyticus]TYP87571.1 putative membrane protein DUF2306 [Blastococcus xanthinilyticus]
MTSAAPPTSRPRLRWLVPAALIALALVPLAAGAARLVELSGGAAVLPEAPRSAAVPLPLVVHIVSALVFTVVGAFQFVPGTRGRRPRWHRVTGRIAAPAGLVTALSGLWLTIAITGADGGLLTLFRAAAGIGMAGSLALGVIAVLRRDLARHRAWMLRGYALGIAAGTQVFTAGAWLAVVGEISAASEAWPMGAGWLINLAVAEWLIRRPSGRRRTPPGSRTAPVQPVG